MNNQNRTVFSITSDEVKRIVGDVSDHKLAALIATGASVSDLEKAAAWVMSQDAPGDDRILPEGRIGELCEILSPLEADQFEEEER